MSSKNHPNLKKAQITKTRGPYLHDYIALGSIKNKQISVLREYYIYKYRWRDKPSHLISWKLLPLSQFHNKQGR